MTLINKIICLLFHLLILCYQALFSISAGRQCRFEPTCSHYAIQTLKEHHIITAFYLIIKRLLKCLPFNRYAENWHFDPVLPCGCIKKPAKYLTSKSKHHSLIKK